MPRTRGRRSSRGATRRGGRSWRSSSGSKGRRHRPGSRSCQSRDMLIQQPRLGEQEVQAAACHQVIITILIFKGLVGNQGVRVEGSGGWKSYYLLIYHDLERWGSLKYSTFLSLVPGSMLLLWVSRSSSEGLWLTSLDLMLFLLLFDLRVSMNLVESSFISESSFMFRL